MSEPAGSPIPAEVIPQLGAAAAKIAAAHEEPAPASITGAPTTRVKALDLLFRGSTVPASYDAPSYAVVMTGHFASYGGPTSRHTQIKWPRRGRCLKLNLASSRQIAARISAGPAGRPTARGSGRWPSAPRADGVERRSGTPR